MRRGPAEERAGLRGGQGAGQRGGGGERGNPEAGEQQRVAREADFRLEDVRPEAIEGG